MFHSNLTVLMNTRQNYGPAGGPANPVVSTAQPNEQTVISDPQAASAPALESPELHLSYSTAIDDISSGLVTYRALSHYKTDRIKWLIKYAKEGHTVDAAYIFSEIERIDELLDEVVEGFQSFAVSATRRIVYLEKGHVMAPDQAAKEQSLVEALEEFLAV